MSQSKVYVGNLPYETTDEQLEELFAQFGPINEVKLITDRDTGRSKGFAFVTFESPEGAKKSVDALDGNDFNGRNLKVSPAKEKSQTGGGGRRRSGGFGGAGGNSW